MVADNRRTRLNASGRFILQLNGISTDYAATKAGLFRAAGRLKSSFSVSISNRCQVIFIVTKTMQFI